MKKTLFILVSFFILTLTTFPSGVEIGNVSVPGFVKTGETFFVSAKVYRSIDDNSVYFFLHTENEVALKSAYLKGPTIQKQMRFYRENINSQFEKVYKIESGDLSSSQDEIMQINLELSASGNEDIELLITSYERLSENEIERRTEKINLYKESRSAGKCLKIFPSTKVEFDFTFEENHSGRILVEFWANLSSNQSKVFSLDDGNGNEIANFSISEFGYLTTSHLLDAEFFREYFLNVAGWNYFLLLIDKEFNRVELYSNDYKIYSGIISEINSQDNFTFTFFNDSQRDQLLVERIKIWSFNNNLRLAFRNKNFNRYSADSSSVLYQNNFDSDKATENIIYRGQIGLVKSTAPIFSQAPTLYVSLYGQSFQINWEVNDLSRAEKFLVEKSYDGRDYHYVNSIRVIDNSKNIYSTTDQDFSNNQIIYYRVKQINDDGSSVYSSDAKVGRGKIKHFKLNQNFPNPFNPNTTISVNVTRADEFEVLVYDIVGKIVTVLHQGPLSEGTHQFSFDGSEIPSGLYLCEIKSGDELEVMKMILAK
ncbi:MAG: T9SS type A sorting domain-containing protein [Melioribacteraceae bacterium]|nr:MAG: T9SS type A sorting domain-containing protein [Melioribacteraceae bacterium]